MDEKKFNHFKVKALARWMQSDLPGGEPVFQIPLLLKDVAVFVFLPLLAIIMSKACEKGSIQSPKERKTVTRQQDTGGISESKSQIINFSGNPKGSGFKRTPGTLVRLKLLNAVETYNSAPVHAQIVDYGLGRELIGGSIIGDATDSSYGRINVIFHYVRDPNSPARGVAITARALSLDGTLGLPAQKKEGFFTRSTLASSETATQDAQGRAGATDFKQILFRALTAGLLQEFGNEAQVERNKANVLTLSPGVEFFAELTDAFPSSGAGK